MTSWTTIGFQLGLRPLAQAYRASVTAHEAEAAEWEARWAQHEADVKAGRAPVPDQAAPYDYEFGDEVGEGLHEVERGLAEVRQAFALALNHFWEKQAKSLLQLERYVEPAVFTAAKSDQRFTLDEPGLRRLRKIANCIKHGSGAELYRAAPELFDPRLIPEDRASADGWSDALVLTDEELRRAFEAVKISGPRSFSSGAQIEEVEL